MVIPVAIPLTMHDPLTVATAVAVLLHVAAGSSVS